MPQKPQAITPKRSRRATSPHPGPTLLACYPPDVGASPESPLVNGRRYLRAPVPVHFPEGDVVPEGGLHFELRTALFLVLRGELAGRAFVGSDQFLYWNPVDPTACVAPDIMVRLGAPDAPVPSWKVWENGAPHVAVEIVSPTESATVDWSTKLERYRHSGVRELVRFDPEDSARPLRLWDRVDGDLVERDLTDATLPSSDSLALYWCVTPDARLGRTLRLARDSNGAVLVPTPGELNAVLAAEARQANSERDEALAKLAELEAELRKRDGSHQ